MATNINRKVYFCHNFAGSRTFNHYYLDSPLWNHPRVPARSDARQQTRLIVADKNAMSCSKVSYDVDLNNVVNEAFTMDQQNAKDDGYRGTSPF